MVYVIVAIVVVVVLLGVLMARRKSPKRGVSYAPDLNEMSEDLFSPGSRFRVGEIPQVAVPTSEVATESMAHDEFVSDVSDDLLDPRNPQHAEWVKEHPGMETDDEWLAEHPEDNPA